MTRPVFLLIAGLMAAAFGAAMLLAPGAMLTNMARATPDAQLVLQWMGVVLFSLGVINILSRSDPGSPALVAVMTGNLIVHIVGFGIDVYHHLLGFVQASGVAMGGVVHGLLTAGFAYYLAKSPTR